MLAIEKLYEKYRQDVYRYLLSLTRDTDVAEDLLSECFLIVIRKLPFFRGESTVKTWLFGIARNCWLQYLRKQHPAITLDDMIEVYMADDIAGQVINRQLCDRIIALLRQENERTQRTVNMRINGYSHREIAVQLGISEGAVRVIDHRTKKRIREILIQEGYDNHVTE